MHLEELIKSLTRVNQIKILLKIPFNPPNPPAKCSKKVVKINAQYKMKI
jgi:hypothetical protein